MRAPGSATGQILHGLVDTDDVPLDVLQVNRAHTEKSPMSSQGLRGIVDESMGGMLY